MKKWFKAAGIRALKTMSQAILILTGADMVNIFTIDLKQIIGVAIGMGFVSLLTSILGLPELEKEENANDTDY